MRIHPNFIGGNISVKEINGNTVVLENQLRDTPEDWFYWAFCVEDAENQTLTFKFQKNRLGYFGPAVSYDLMNWHWLDRVDADSFTYHFGKNERKVYFAHSMLYHPNRFLHFAASHNIQVKELCQGYHGSHVPCIMFGAGNKSIILTARHHACESTGNYVLEGVLEEWIANPIPDTKVFCVPFVDYEGVIRGDQGKHRAPHDHYLDYDTQKESMYPECDAIKAYVKANGCDYGFDFHSPWHKSNEHDTVFIVQNRAEELERLNRFGELFENSITSKSFQYAHKHDFPPETQWNHFGPQFPCYLSQLPENRLAFTMETAYFGTLDNRVNEERLLELGHCFVRALKKYIETEQLQ